MPSSASVQRKSVAREKILGQQLRQNTLDWRLSLADIQETERQTSSSSDQISEAIHLLEEGGMGGCFS